MEACELYEALEALTEEMKDESFVAEDKEEMIRKIERFQVLAKKKTDIQKEANHEIKMLREVEADQKSDIARKDKEIGCLKKAAQSNKDKFKKDLEVQQKKYSDVVKENANLKTMVKEKQSMVVALEEQLKEVSEDDDERSVIEEIVTMGNNISGHKCTICNTKFSTNEDLERHIKDKHTESDCPFCNETFSSNSRLRNHVNKCTQNDAAKVKCNKCKAEVTQFGMRSHNKQCHKKTVEEYKCEECGMLANTTAKLRNHIHKEHENWVEKSQEICYHYRKGFCFRGDSCKFAHVGRQHRNRSDSTARPSTERNWTPACNKGEGCSWLTRGACKFFHKGVGVQRQAPTQHRPNQTNSNQGRHNQFSVNSMAGFPPLRGGNQQTRRNGPRN